MNLSPGTRVVLSPVFAAIVVIFSLANMLGGQEIDGEAKGRLTKIKYLVDQGGKFFKSGDFADSAAKIREAQTALISLAESGNKAVIDLLKKDYERIETARKLLTAKGEEFEALPELGSIMPKSKPGSTSKDKQGSDSMDAPAAGSDDTEMISFTKQVAPIILQNCGQCHVEESRGKYSAATYPSLIKGTRKGKAVKPGDLEMSRMIVRIEEGTMPPEGPPVPDDQVAILKTWIEQGAKFDGEKNKRNANLTSYVPVDGSGTNGAAGRPGDSNAANRERRRDRPTIGALGGDRDEDQRDDDNKGRGGGG